MDAAVGGRIAEEIVYGIENAGTGATGDFQSLTKLARSYVLRYGFSEKVTFASCERPDLVNIRSDIILWRMKM